MNREVVKRTILYVLVLIAALYIIIPYLWVVLVSFMQEREAIQLHWIPREPTLENYAMYFQIYGESAEIGAATARQFPRAIVNSFIIGGMVMFINLFFGSLAAYALARMNFWWQPRAAVVLSRFAQCVPGVAIMIPMYLVMRSYGLLDTHIAVILAHVTFTLPFTIWILKGYFQTVPLDLERAARVDGCSRLGALFRVFLPVTTPGMIAVGIFLLHFIVG